MIHSRIGRIDHSAILDEVLCLHIIFRHVDDSEAILKVLALIYKAYHYIGNGNAGDSQH